MKSNRKFFKATKVILMLLLAVMVTFFGDAWISDAYATNIDSSNTNLKEFTVTQELKNGEIKEVKYTPEFSPDTMEYHATLDADCVSLHFSTKTEAAGSKVTYNWMKMDKGDNKSWVKVTASNGSTKDYYIYSNVPDTNEETTSEEESTDETEETKEQSEEGKESEKSSDENGNKETETAKAVSGVTPGSLDVTIDGKKYKVSKTIDDAVKVPSGFSKESYDFEGSDVEAVKSADTKVIGLYLTDSKGKGALYCYNSSQKTFARMVSVRDSRRIFTFADYTDYSAIPDKYKEADLKVRKVGVKAWSLGNGSAYYLVYAVDSEGTMDLYSYNAQDGTFQKFNQIDYGSVAGVDEENYNNLQSSYDDMKNKAAKTKSNLIKIIIAGGLVILIMLFALIHLILKIKEYNSLEEEEMYDVNRDDASLGSDFQQFNASDVEQKSSDVPHKKVKNRKKNLEEKKNEEPEDEPEESQITEEPEISDYQFLDGEEDNLPEGDHSFDSKTDEDDLDIADILAEANSVKVENDEPKIKKPVMRTKVKEEQKQTSVKDIVDHNKTDYGMDTSKSDDSDDVEDIFSDLNIDLTDSILAELAQTSAKIEEDNDGQDIDLPDFETESLPDLEKFGIDLNKLKDDAPEDDFEFFDYDDMKDKK